MSVYAMDPVKYVFGLKFKKKKRKQKIPRVCLWSVRLEIEIRR